MMRLIVVSIFMFVIMLLGGCRVLVEPFVCVSGICPSNKNRIAAIPWTPTTLNKHDCQGLDGNYKETGWFANNKQSKETLFRQFDFRLGGDNESSNEHELQVSYQTYQETPYDRIETGMNYEHETKTFSKKYRIDESAFYEIAVISIKQQAELLEVILMDQTGAQYRKSILNLNHPQIGCLDGALIIRAANAFGANEGSYGSVTAREKIFKRLANGYLQITTRDREWLFTPSSGLMGMNAQGHPAGTEPRKTERIYIYPAAP